MINILANWELFLPQIIIGSVIGALLSVIGILLVLRNMTFFGVTLSQAVSFSVAFSLFMAWESELAPILLSMVLIFPMLLLRKSITMKEEVILGILFVFFASLSQVLLALGGNVQNHLLASYFGDILTSQVKLNSLSVWLALFSFFVYISLFRRFLFLSFDMEEYRIQIGNPVIYDTIFYMILSVAVTVAVNLLGSFYSIAHMLIPVFTLLPFVRSTRVLAILCILFSIAGTVGGFLISLTGINYHGGDLFSNIFLDHSIYVCPFFFSPLDPRFIETILRIIPILKIWKLSLAILADLNRLSLSFKKQALLVKSFKS